MNPKRILRGFAIVSLCLFIIIYIIIQLVSGLSTDVECIYADVSSVASTLQTKAYIFRNETVLQLNTSGIVNYNVKEAEKISRNQLVATVFQSNDSIQIQKEINAIDQMISVYEKSALETSYLTSGVSKIDSKIYTQLNSLKSNVVNNTLSGVSQVKRDLLINFNKKFLVSNNKTGFINQIEALASKKEILISSLNSNFESVFSQNSGYFSTMIDGYESIYEIDKISTINIDDLKSIINKPKIDYSNNVIGKVITDYDWYAACIISNEDAASFKQGMNYNLSFIYSSGEVINANLFRKVTQTDSDETALIFRIDKVFADFDYTRCQICKISTGNESGISIPKSAIRLTDKGLGVYTLEGSTVGFKLISIENKDDTNFICTCFDPNDPTKKEYLAKHDRIIISGKNLYEGRIIN